MTAIVVVVVGATVDVVVDPCTVLVVVDTGTELVVVDTGADVVVVEGQRAADEGVEDDATGPCVDLGASVAVEVLQKGRGGGDA